MTRLKDLPNLSPPEESDPEEEKAGRTELNHAVRLGPHQSARPWLLVVSGGASLGTLVRIQNNMIVGRGAEADFVLDEQGVSRQHAKLEVLVGNVVRISDLGSSNGVRVDGVRVKSKVLRDGERIRLGDVVLTLIRMDDDPPTMRKNLVESLDRPPK